MPSGRQKEMGRILPNRGDSGFLLPRPAILTRRAAYAGGDDGDFRHGKEAPVGAKSNQTGSIFPCWQHSVEKVAGSVMNLRAMRL